MPFILAAVLYLFLEGYILFWAADLIGPLWVFLLLAASALFGVYLVRSHGLAVFFRANQALERGESPHAEMLDGIVLFFCGIIFIVPGFLSDIIVLPLLVPALRRAVVRRMGKRMQQPHRHFSSSAEKWSCGGVESEEYRESGGRRGPFVFYKFFMSGQFSEQNTRPFEKKENDFFDGGYKNSDIIDVTPNHPADDNPELPPQDGGRDKK